MIHIWLANSHITSHNNALRVWQPTTQSWQTAENWQEVGTLVSLQSGTKTAKTKQICLYFPSINLLKVQPNLLANQLKALGESGRRYLFEDISIGSVEDLQVKADTAPMPSLYAIHQSDREQWENAISLVGLTLTALLPDFLLLPTEVLPPQILSDSPATNNEFSPQSALYYQDAATQLLAFPQAYMPKTAGLAVSHLPMLLTKMPQLENLWLMTANPMLSSPSDFASFSQSAIHTTDALPRPVAEPIRAFFNFAIKNSDTSVPAYARIIGMVFLAAVLFGLIVDGLRWYHYQKALVQTQSALAMQYNQWFPNEKYSLQLNLQRKLESKLVNNQNVDNKVLSVLSTIQPVFQQNQITATNLTYQGQSLQLNVIANNAETLNKVVNQLVTQGINAKLGSISGNTGVIATAPVTGVSSAPSGMNNTLANAAKPSAGSNIATIQIAL